MRKPAALALVILALLALSACARANPVPGPEVVMYPCYWLIKTLPFDYALDLVSLCLALLVFGQSQAIAWRFVPLYNLAVVIAGYISDWGARALTGYPAYVPTAKDPVIGPLVHSMDPTMSNYGDFTFVGGIAFIAVAAALIYLFNLAILYGILRVNDACHEGKLLLAAAVPAVLTAPYIALRADAKAAWFVPLTLACLGFGGFALAKNLRNRRIIKRKA